MHKFSVMVLLVANEKRICSPSTADRGCGIQNGEVQVSASLCDFSLGLCAYIHTGDITALKKNNGGLTSAWVKGMGEVPHLQKQEKCPLLWEKGLCISQPLVEDTYWKEKSNSPFYT